MGKDRKRQINQIITPLTKHRRTMPSDPEQEYNAGKKDANDFSMAKPNITSQNELAEFFKHPTTDLLSSASVAYRAGFLGVYAEQVKHSLPDTLKGHASYLLGYFLGYALYQSQPEECARIKKEQEEFFKIIEYPGDLSQGFFDGLEQTREKYHAVLALLDLPLFTPKEVQEICYEYSVGISIFRKDRMTAEDKLQFNRQDQMLHITSIVWEHLLDKSLAYRVGYVMKLCIEKSEEKSAVTSEQVEKTFSSLNVTREEAFAIICVANSKQRNNPKPAILSFLESNPILLKETLTKLKLNAAHLAWLKKDPSTTQIKKEKKTYQVSRTRALQHLLRKESDKKIQVNLENISDFFARVQRDYSPRTTEVTAGHIYKLGWIHQAVIFVSEKILGQTSIEQFENVKEQLKKKSRDILTQWGYKKEQEKEILKRLDPFGRGSIEEMVEEVAQKKGVTNIEDVFRAKIEYKKGYHYIKKNPPKALLDLPDFEETLKILEPLASRQTTKSHSPSYAMGYTCGLLETVCKNIGLSFSSAEDEKLKIVAQDFLRKKFGLAEVVIATMLSLFRKEPDIRNIFDARFFELKNIKKEEEAGSAISRVPSPTTTDSSPAIPSGSPPASNPPLISSNPHRFQFGSRGSKQPPTAEVADDLSESESAEDSADEAFSP